jgi:hypothetical protein
MKNRVNAFGLQEYYEKELYRKLKWYSYINKQRSEANMVNDFKKKFNCIPERTHLLIGDFCEKRPKKYNPPTMGKSFRKLFLDAGFNVHIVNEFRTSRWLYQTGEELCTFRTVKRRPRIRKDQRYYDTKNNPVKTKSDELKSRTVHRLLGSKILTKDGKRTTIINRDLNGSLNIRLVGIYTLLGLELPDYFKREKREKRDVVLDIKLPVLRKANSSTTYSRKTHVT